MAAFEGNENAKKLKTPELCAEAYKQYCAHIANGKSKRSWCFDHPELTLTWETMEKYLEDEVVFDPKKKKIAESKGFAKWEKVCEESADGTNRKANTASLQMIMRNKFGWDKESKQSGSPVDESHGKNLDKMMNKLCDLQSQSASKISDNITIKE